MIDHSMDIGGTPSKIFIMAEMKERWSKNEQTGLYQRRLF